MGRAFIFVSWILGCGSAPTPRRSEAEPDASPTDCGGHPFAAGCPCDFDDAAQPCWEGDDAQMNVGACRTGITTCWDGAWGACEGIVLPVDETCNAIDDDCDGDVDQGVLGPCGHCNCESTCWGEGPCDPWGDVSAGTRETESGALELADVGPVPHVLWLTDIGGVADAPAPGAIYRFDTRDRTAAGSYWTTPDRDQSYVTAHVATDANGDVYVVAVSDPVDDAAWSSLARIAADPGDCVDRDGDGVVDTSTGPNDRLAFDASDTWDDECIRWFTYIGDEAGREATVAAVGTELDLDGATRSVAWVGFKWEPFSLESYDAETGEWTGTRIGTGSVSDLLVDADGVLWSVHYQSLSHLDPVGGDADWLPEQVLPLGVDDGFTTLTIDESGRFWVAGTRVAWREAEGEWQLWDAPGGKGGVFGNIVADARGHAWATWLEGADDALYQVAGGPDEELTEIADTRSGLFASAIDFDGELWTFGWMWSGGHVVDLVDEALEDVLDEGPFVRTQPLGDFTGFRAWTAKHPRPPWTAIVEPCVGVEWLDATLRADVPVGTEIRVEARTAVDRDSLVEAPWTQLGRLPGGASFDLATLGFEGDALEIRVRLIGYEATPKLQEVEVTWACPP